MRQLSALRLGLDCADNAHEESRFELMQISLTSKPSLSAIIPRYNGEAFAADAITSLLRQILPQLSTESLCLIKQPAAQPRGTL